MGIRSKASHFVSDVTTAFLNPLSDKPSTTPASPLSSESQTKYESGKVESVSDEESEASRDGPDTSSFTAFLYSLLSASDSGSKSDSEEKNHDTEDLAEPSDVPVLRDSGRKKSLFSRGKQSLGKAINHAARLGNFRSQSSTSKGSSDDIIENGTSINNSVEERTPVQQSNETVVPEELSVASEPSLLLSKKAQSSLYVALPVLVQGRKWVLLYSTWRHGISLSTLYRRSLLWPGLSLLVVGDRKGAVFGGLVEAPLRPTNKRSYQGNNDSFVFTNLSGDPAFFRPTGVNRYFTLCSNEYIALGGGGHFALYLDGDLLLGSSSASETYGNPCLANSENFEVKEVELWGFVYASKYEEMISFLRAEAPPGICRW